ncbi:MAG: hypothetical protein HYR63_22480 [Proteobacteria bacterium]|nr:hypothetical protein [Pseudomonadota bacterium]MBI3497616.1 hypothetical protein [Pseudomonadota bacterium]
MNFSSLSELTDALKARTSEMMTDEPDEIRQFRSGTLENKAGSYGQYFGTWDIAAGMVRDYSMYTMYPILQLAENPRLDHEQFRAVLEALDPPYSNYLRYSGFPQMGEYAAALRSLIGRNQSRDEVIQAMRAYVAYTNRMAAWSFHYFPWGLGKHFQYAEPDVAPPDISDLKRRVRIKNGQPIRLTWQPLGVSVKAVLATNENPELCEDLLRALPFTILQDHAVVTGESMYAWTPVVSTAPIRVRERICDAPRGRLRYSQSTGQKLIVQYGPTTEDLAQPVLGEVLEPDAARLAAVGRKVWESTYETKERIWLTVEAA